MDQFINSIVSSSYVYAPYVPIQFHSHVIKIYEVVGFEESQDVIFIIKWFGGIIYKYDYHNRIAWRNNSNYKIKSKRKLRMAKFKSR